MKVSEILVAQLDREIALTRIVLERVPDGKADWKPYPRSRSLGSLSSLVVRKFGWIAMIIQSDHLDFTDAGYASSASTGAERLALLEKLVADAREALNSATDEHLMKPWQLRVAGVVHEKPRYVMITDMFSQLAHFRGQLTVYLRLNEQPVPSVYGPTAEESCEES
jgi:hypothetical protein